MRNTLLLIGLTLPLPALAQQRVVVIPAGVEVALPSREAGPVAARGERITSRNRPAPRRRAPERDSGMALAGGMGLAGPALIGLPLLAAAAVVAGNGLPGGGGGTSAPARTR
jgi:hypothetical protein